MFGKKNIIILIGSAFSFCWLLLFGEKKKVNAAQRSAYNSVLVRCQVKKKIKTINIKWLFLFLSFFSSLVIFVVRACVCLVLKKKLISSVVLFPTTRAQHMHEKKKRTLNMITRRSMVSFGSLPFHAIAFLFLRITVFD